MEAVVVLALVFSPVDMTPLVPHQVSERWWGALKETACALELAGPSCKWIPDFRSEVRWTRNYRREARNWPSIWDCDRLPPKSLCEEYAHDVRQRGELLCHALAERLHWAAYLEGAIRECELVWTFWREASYAQDEGMLWTTRRRNLNELRLMLGREAYEAGEWPYP
jgi:hypothetical protein